MYMFFIKVHSALFEGYRFILCEAIIKDIVEELIISEK